MFEIESILWDCEVTALIKKDENFILKHMIN